MADDKFTIGRIAFGPGGDDGHGLPLRKRPLSKPVAYVSRGRDRAVNYMIVTYKCGCEVRGREADHTCPQHPSQGIRKIARITEFVDVPDVKLR